jgi:hypothetical protein
MGLSEAALDGLNQTFSQLISALRAAEAAPKRIHNLLLAGSSSERPEVWGRADLICIMSK